MLTVTAPEEEPSDLQRHFAATYFTMRLGLGIVAVGFPLLLVIGGRLSAGLPLQDSMSAYYHAGSGVMRTWFVGILFTLGTLLYLYKGFSTRENVALNLAGIGAVLVAVFPMEWSCGAACSKFTVHGASAVIAFLCIAYVAAFCADDTLKLVRDPKRLALLRNGYRVLAALMLLSPIAAFVVTSLLNLRNSLVFFLEAFGILAFALYWFLKGRELRETHADYIAQDGTLVARA